jgi:hypothetical protein
MDELLPELAACKLPVKGIFKQASFFIWMIAGGMRWKIL